MRAPTPPTLFELGNVATTLLILRATELLHTDGRTLARATSLGILLYAAHNAAATLASLAGGRSMIGSTLVRCSPREPACTRLAYLGFPAQTRAWMLLLAAFALAGVGVGLAETAESTLGAQSLPDCLRGNSFGLLGLVPVRR